MIDFTQNYFNILCEYIYIYNYHFHTLMQATVNITYPSSGSIGLTPPLSVPAGRLTGRAETLPVGFWVTGRPSGEVLPRLSLPVERKTPPEGFR